jgi:hypothetical protein
MKLHDRPVTIVQETPSELVNVLPTVKAPSDASF